MKLRVEMPPVKDIWIVYAMRMRMVVLGMYLHVNMQPVKEIWIVYAMHMRMVALG